MSNGGRLLCHIRIDDFKCKRCYTCIDSCPRQAITLDKGVFNHCPFRCQYCENCMDVCPEDAITIKEI